MRSEEIAGMIAELEWQHARVEAWARRDASDPDADALALLARACDGLDDAIGGLELLFDVADGRAQGAREG